MNISAEQKGPDWVISIRDNGIAFDSKYALTIFEPFKRLHTTEEYPGTGVGLAIAVASYRLKRGRIWAESQLGEGTTFRFTLPVESSQPLRHTPPIDIPRSNASVKTAG